MEDFKQVEDNKYQSIYGNNLGNNNLYNTNIQEENERKFDILLDGLLNFK